MSEITANAPPELGRVQYRSLIIGVVGLILLLVGAFVSPRGFFHAYLIGYMFWIGITLGCLSLLLVQHAAGGAWGLVIRRVLEAATRTLPLMFLLFVPILIGSHSLYEWTHADVVAVDPILQIKRKYLNLPFFIVRWVIYFAIWIGLAYFLNKWSRMQDTSADRFWVRRLRRISAPGIILYVLTLTFASIDWVSSLDPHWFSTIFGLLFVASQAMLAMAFVIAMMVLLMKREPMASLVQPNHFHDLGKLLLAFVMLWAYFYFSQFLIIWSGNLPEETPWYLRRLAGGWQWLAAALVLLHFALPFVTLLSRDLKRDARRLVFIAVLLLAMRLVDLIWLIGPQLGHGGHHVTPFDWILFVLAPLGLGGIWLAVFIWQLKGWPLLPLRDPHLAKALASTGGH